MSEKLEFDLSVKNNQLDKALESGNKKALNLEGTLSTALGVFGGNLITKGFDLVVDGFQGLANFAREAARASSENQVEINNLNASLSRAGILTRETSEELQAYAANIEATTLITGGAATETISYLATLTRLDKEGLQRATTAAIDLSVALGIDLASAQTLVAKAANGNISAFSRYGIEIQKGATNAETFANTLEKLNSQFGGAANSQLNTSVGAVTALANAYESALEPIGDIVVTNPLVTSTINAIKDVVVDLTKTLQENKVAYTELVTDGILFAISSAQVLFDALDGITVVSKALFNVLVTGSNAITLGVVEPFRLAYDAALLLLQNIPLVGQAFEGLKNPLDGIADSLRENVIAGFDDIANSADGNVFRDLSDGAGSFANKVIEGAEKIKLANAEIKNSNRSVVDEQDALSDEQLAKIAEFNSQKIALQSQFDSEQKALQAELEEINIQNEFERNEAAIQRILEQKLRENEISLQAELDKNKGINDARVKAAADDKAFEQKRLADLKAFKDKEVGIEKLGNQTFLSDRAAFFNAAASLSNSKSRELAAIGKAAAIANATIAGKEAVVSSYRFGAGIGGPALGAVFAGIASAATASQIAQIAGVQFEQGGVVGGASMGPDNRVATIRDGEMVLNASQQKNLMDMLTNGGMGGDIVIQINEREIARAVRNQKQLGFAV